MNGIVIAALAAAGTAFVVAVCVVVIVNRLARFSRERAAVERTVGGPQLDAMRDEVRHELDRLGNLVHQIGESSARRFGSVDNALRMHADVTGKLAESTSSLREALANPQARGRWGERMAEDVLRLAGFVENVNYRKQAAAGPGRPDFVFELPKSHVLYMDVKFPLAAYLRYLDATTEPAKAAELKAFLRDVRARVKELAARRYSESTGRGTKPSLDYVLLFLPNEQLTGFIHQHDPALLDDALRQRVVMCSPLTLYAFLGVIREAFDNFMIEQTSEEILELVGAFSVQWRRYVESSDKVKRHFEAVHAEFDKLTTARERAVERPLRQLEALRSQRPDPEAPAEQAADHTASQSDGGPPLRVVER